MNETDIIQSALRLVENNNIRFSILDIAQDLKTSKRTFYQFFESKEALIKAATAFVFDDIERQHFEILKEDISEIEKLKRVLCVYPSVISFETAELGDMIAAYPEVSGYINRHLEAKWDLTIALFESCKQKGYLRPLSQTVFRTVFLGIYEQCLAAPDHRRLTEECVDAVMQGMLKIQPYES